MKRSLLLFGLVIVMAARINAEESGGTNSTWYDADPKHIWNRLNENLFLRTAPDGKQYGLGRLDILFWDETAFLLKGPSHQKALAVLDEFIETHAEKKVQDPIKRAWLQRDLWQLFDWSTVDTWRNRRLESGAERKELQRRLAVVIRRLALTPGEIASLPDNYAKADASGALANLPRGLFQTNADWVCVGVNGGDPITLAHAEGFGGRSVFLVMLRVPGGRQAGIDYLRQLNSADRPWTYLKTANPNDRASLVLRSDLPQFPINTTWALVRRMCLIDTNGEIAAAPITENIQVRRYLKILPGDGFASRESFASSQETFEFQLNRRQPGTLRELGREEKDFLHVQFLGLGIDPLEHSVQSANRPPDSTRYLGTVLSGCVDCHGRAGGINSVLSYARMFYPVTITPPSVASFDPQWEIQATIGYKQRRFDWGLLQGMWR